MVLLNYETAAIVNVSVTLCAPRSVEAFNSSVTSPLNFNACKTYLHALLSLTLSIAVVDVNEPPVFDQTYLSLSAPGIGVVNQPIGFPLSSIASDPDVAPPFNSPTFSLSSGSCGNTPVLAALPVAINTDDGQLLYRVSGPLNAWPNPLSLCVVVTDGGGLNASADVSLRFTDVDMQLSVFPAVLNVTHYSFGTSTHNVSVNFYAGTYLNESWTVESLSVPWLQAVQVSARTLSVTTNSTLLPLSQETRVGGVLLTTTGMLCVLHN